MGKRIDYIDYLKGLSVTWVVWYHTEHPTFVDYSFRIPLFFFVSGIFFKAYPWKIFWRKKINQLVIPFILFYLIYYIYLLGINFLKYNSLEHFRFLCLLDMFQTYSGNESFTVNPPLWFICALINLQLLLYASINLLKQNWYILIFSFIISIIGLFYIHNCQTPFMIGRSLPYFVYYVLGFIFGKKILYQLENSQSYSIKIGFFCLITFILLLINNQSQQTFISELFNYLQNISIIILLIITFKNIYSNPIVLPLKYFGLNSYIVLGMHEIYHTTFRIIIENIFGYISVTLGIIQTLLTLTLLWPTIYLLNKYIPFLVAKQDLIPIPKQ